MMLKTLHITALALLVLTCVSACGCDKPDKGTENGSVALEASPLELNFGSAESLVPVSVKAPYKPSAVSTETWCKASVGAFADNACTLSVRVSENSSASERTAAISLVCGSERVRITVTQDAALSPEPEDFLAEVVPGDNNAWTMARKLGMGWNLGNQMDGYDNGVANETVWGNKAATQATFDGLKDKGFTSVRIPVTWLGHIGEAPSYTLETVWLDRVAELVGYAEKAGLNTVINIHHDGADSAHWLNIKKAAASEADCETITAEYKAVWKQIAERFRDKGDFLIFEAFNELHDGLWGWGGNLSDGGAQYGVINKWVQEFVTTVRAAGGENATRYLGIPGYCANPDLTMANLVLPEDSAKDRLMVAVHCYDPYDYTLECKYGEWGHTAKNNPAPSGEKELVAVLAKLKAKYIDKGIPVYLGETGCSNRDTDRQKRFQAYYLEFLYKACRNYGIPPFYWDNGSEVAGRESGAVISHSTGEYVRDGETMVAAMKKASFNESASYTLRAVYDAAPAD